MAVTLPVGTRGWAEFSEDGTRRFTLTRDWSSALADKRRVLWIMLNPSTAGADQDDPTIRRCCGFARSWGYNGIVVVNLFSLVATNPRALDAEAPLMPPDEIRRIRLEMTTPRFGLLMAAWGSPVIRTGLRRNQVVEEALNAGRTIHCLGRNLDGSPRHPLYVRATQPPIPLNLIS